MGRLDDRNVVVTGAARGIGAAVARMLSAEGAAVVLTDVLDDEGAALADELGSRACYEHLDVTHPDDWRSVIDRAERFAGPLSVLVNNAGILEFGTVEEQSPESFRRVLDVNLYGPWLGLHVAAPVLRRAGGGVVVNVSSTAGLIGYANLGAYVASKWGLRGLTKTAALELARDGVRVCSVHPGPIRTPMIAGVGESIAAGQPIARLGEPEEVAKMVLFLVADATYSTGTEFVVDGGATVGTVVEIPDR